MLKKSFGFVITKPLTHIPWDIQKSFVWSLYYLHLNNVMSLSRPMIVILCRWRAFHINSTIAVCYAPLAYVNLHHRTKWVNKMIWFGWFGLYFKASNPNVHPNSNGGIENNLWITSLTKVIFGNGKNTLGEYETIWNVYKQPNYVAECHSLDYIEQKELWLRWSGNKGRWVYSNKL